MPAGPAPIMIALSSLAYSDMAGVEHYVCGTIALVANMKRIWCIEVKTQVKKKNHNYLEKKWPRRRLKSGLSL
jgi:hypothetical protein